MTSPPDLSDHDVENIGLGPLHIEDLVDRDALREMAESFRALSGVSVRILSPSGALLTGAAPEARLYRLVRANPAGRSAVDSAVDTLRTRAMDSDGVVVQPDFAGAIHRIVPILYEHRSIGRIVLGPYLPEGADAPVEPILALAPGLDPAEANDALRELEVLSEERASAICAHLVATLDLILFSGHKALMTSQMHLASVQASYRELMQKNDELQVAYERLQELDRLKSSFLATISHELRTPLTSIIGYSEMLAEGIGGALTDDQLDFVQTIRQKGDQLLGLIMSLLDLSKLESGTMLMRRVHTSIDGILAEALSSVAPQATKKGVRFRLEVPADLPTLRADADRLRQVFINLVDNAIKFTPAGGEIALSARLSEDVDTESIPGDDALALVLVAPLARHIEVRVADTGVGIAEHERLRVFDPFYQVDQSSTREQGGTGLGLSIVKRIVEGHQGTISISHNQPTGAVFTVRLPMSANSLPPPSKKSSRPPR